MTTRPGPDARRGKPDGDEGGPDIDAHPAHLAPDDLDSLTERLIAALKEEFGGDERRITHAMRVLAHARDISQREGGQQRVVIAAALLHDIGICKAEEKYGSAAPRYQEAEGPPIARRILAEIGFDQREAEHVCSIVASHHSCGLIDTCEFRTLYDADWLVNCPDEFPNVAEADLKEMIARTMKTPAGREIAANMFLG